MTANPPELVRSDEAASLWKSVLHAPSPRLATSTRDALLEHTRCLERTATRAARGDRRARARGVAARRSARRARDGARPRSPTVQARLRSIPVDDVSALRADPSYTFASFVASPANSAARARVLAFARDARAGSGPRSRSTAAPAPARPTCCARSTARSPSRAARTRSCAASAEQLSLELIRALWGDTVERVPRAADVRLRARSIDDIDALAGRDATQEELAQAIAALRRARGPGGRLARQAPRAQLGAVRAAARPARPLRAARGPRRRSGRRGSRSSTPARAAGGSSRARRSRRSSPAGCAPSSGSLDALLTRLMTRSSAGNALADLDVVKQLLDRRGRARASRARPTRCSARGLAPVQSAGARAALREPQRARDDAPPGRHVPDAPPLRPLVPRDRPALRAAITRPRSTPTGWSRSSSPTTPACAPRSS